MASVQRFTDWMKEHKLASVALGLVFLLGFSLFTAGAFIVLNNAGLGSQNAGYDRFDQKATTDASGALSFDGRSDSLPPTQPDGGAGSYVEVQEADFQLDSKDADQDASQIRSLAESHDGYIQQSRRHDADIYRRVYLTVRVPDSEFETFTDTIKEDYDVESHNVRNYRLSTQRELDELALINRTLQDYEEMRERIQDMNTSQKKIELLMSLTEKELDLKERQKEFERQLSDKQKLGNEAVVQIELREQKDIEFLPDDLGNRFMDNVRDMINAVVDVVLSTVTGSIVLFFKALQAIIYLAVVAVPAYIAYRIGRRFYERRKEAE